MEWIKSAGGPLICVEKKLAHAWRGVLETGLTAGPLSDYCRACQVREYLGSIEIEKGRALVLGDMPLETAVWRDGVGVAFIIRLFYFDPKSDIFEYLGLIKESSFDSPDESLVFDVYSDELVIFDSALSGVEQDKKLLSFACRPGRYVILSKIINPDSTASMLLHKFCVVS